MNPVIGEDGRLSILRSDGVEHLAAAEAAVQIDGRHVTTAECEVRVAEHDATGSAKPGDVVELIAGDPEGQVQLRWSIIASKGYHGAELRLTVRNTGDAPVAVERLWPLRARLADFPADRSYHYLAEGAGSWEGKSIERLEGRGQAKLVSGLVADDHHAAVAGFLTVGRYRGFLDWSTPANSPLVLLEAYHSLAGGDSPTSANAATMPQELADLTADEDAAPKPLVGRLEPGEELTSETLFVTIGDVFESFESWADLAGERNHAVRMNPPATGFYTWYYYREHVDEEVLLRNARFLAANRDRFPVNYVHLDWGWQGNYSCGNRELNPGFEHGLAWLAKQIRELGFVPGLWYNVFMHDWPSSELVQKHPELFQSIGDGKPTSFGKPIRNIMAEVIPGMDTWREGEQYRIDPTSAGVAEYLRERYGWAVEQGFGMVMMDFFLNGVWPPWIRPSDPSQTWEHALRHALEVIRETIGPETMIMGCGAPYEPMIGHGNFVRVAADVEAFWSSVKRGCKPLLWQYFMHDRLWTNYADALSLRDKPSPHWPIADEHNEVSLSLDEAQFYATVTGLTGAAVMIAEDVERLPPERGRLLTLLLPICNEGRFRPIDLFPTDEPRILRRDFSRTDTAGAEAQWSVVGLMNWDDQDDLEGVPLGRLAEAAGGAGSPRDAARPDGPRWHAYDVHAERYLGALGAEERIAPVEAHGTRLLRLTPVAARPQLIGSTMHISQGAVETSAERWSPDATQLTIDLCDLEGRRGELIVCVPADMRLAKAGGASGDARPLPAGSSWPGAVIAVPVVLDADKQLVLEFEPKEAR